MTNQFDFQTSTVSDQLTAQTAADLRQPIRRTCKPLFRKRELFKTVPKLLSSAAVLFVTSLFATEPLQAERATDEPLSVMQAVADEWNHGHFPSPAYFESSLTVVDDTPPFLFQGPDAVKRWIEAYRSNQPKSSEGSQTTLHFLQPKLVETNGDRAYIAVPAEWIVKQ